MWKESHYAHQRPWGFAEGDVGSPCSERKLANGRLGDSKTPQMRLSTLSSSPNALAASWGGHAPVPLLRTACAAWRPHRAVRANSQQHNERRGLPSIRKLPEVRSRLPDRSLPPPLERTGATAADTPVDVDQELWEVHHRAPCHMCFTIKRYVWLPLQGRLAGWKLMCTNIFESAVLPYTGAGPVLDG